MKTQQGAPPQQMGGGPYLSNITNYAQAPPQVLNQMGSTKNSSKVRHHQQQQQDQPTSATGTLDIVLLDENQKDYIQSQGLTSNGGSFYNQQQSAGKQGSQYWKHNEQLQQQQPSSSQNQHNQHLMMIPQSAQPQLQAQFSSTQRVTGISKDQVSVPTTTLGHTMPPSQMHELLRQQTNQAPHQVQQMNYEQSSGLQQQQPLHNLLKPQLAPSHHHNNQGNYQKHQSHHQARQHSAQPRATAQHPPTNNPPQLVGNYDEDPNERSANYHQHRQQHQPQNGARTRPSSSKRGVDETYQQEQLQWQGPASSQQQKHSQQQQREISESKFSQLVCQVPQNGVDMKQQQQIQIQQYNSNRKKVESTATTPKPLDNGGMLSQQQRQAKTTLDYQHQSDEPYLLGPQRREDFGKKTLVLDLDETLVHSSFKPIENPDIILPVEIEGSICNIFILVRPGVSQFLKRMHRHYEVVVFTASLSKYADPLVDIIDPERICSYKLFREHCTWLSNAYVKDMSRLGRQMTDIIIVDNSPVAYMLQPENAMPIISWYDDPSDRQLQRIGTLLEQLAYEADVRKIIRKIIVNNEIDSRAEQIYLHSNKRDHSQRVPPPGSSVASSQSSSSAALAQPVVSQYYQGHHNPHQKNNKVVGHVNLRYESADNRNKHAAIVTHELNQRKNAGGGNSFTAEDTDLEDFTSHGSAGDSDGFNRVPSKQSQIQQTPTHNLGSSSGVHQLQNQKNQQASERQHRYGSGEMVAPPTPPPAPQYSNTSANMIPKYHRDQSSSKYQQHGNEQQFSPIPPAPASNRPQTTKGNTSQRNASGLFVNTKNAPPPHSSNPHHSNYDQQYNGYTTTPHQQQQNATPIAKQRATSVKHKDHSVATQNGIGSQQNGKESSRGKERGHSASSSAQHNQRGAPKTADQEVRKKPTFSNFLNHTQKINLAGGSNMEGSNQSEKRLQQHHSNHRAPNHHHQTQGSTPSHSAIQPNQTGVSPRPSTAGYMSSSSSHNHHHHHHGHHHHQPRQSSQQPANASAGGHGINLAASQKLNPQHLSLYGGGTPQNSGHNKKISTNPLNGQVTGGTQTLKQSLKDLQEMLKITQNKLNKTGSLAPSQPKGQSQEDASFLKKLSKQTTEMVGGTPQSSNNIVLLHQQQPSHQYASRYGGGMPVSSSSLVSAVNSPKYKENHQPSQIGSPILSQQQAPPPKHQKRSSNSFQQTQPITLSPKVVVDDQGEEQRSKQVKGSAGSQVRATNSATQQLYAKQPPTVPNHQPLQPSTSKFINSYINQLSSTNATPTQAQSANQMSSLKQQMSNILGAQMKNADESQLNKTQLLNFYNSKMQQQQRQQ